METREFFVWVEKYRPQTLQDCILSKSVAASLQGVLDREDTPHLLFTGSAGIGKTTMAKALVNELKADALVINASEDGLIDTLRGRIRDFASAYSLTDGRKFVILDEADNTSRSMQDALRGFMEEFAATTCFILTCNFPQRIIDAIRSRCSEVDFRIPADERPTIAMRFTKRAFEILTSEGIIYDKRIVANVVALYFPDFRRVLNELQRFSASATLSEAILSQLSDTDVSSLFAALKKLEFDGLRKWVVEHDGMDAPAFYHMLYEQMPKRVDGTCLPELIIIMADYSFRSGQCADQQLNALACLTELMDKGKFK